MRKPLNLQKTQMHQITINLLTLIHKHGQLSWMQLWDMTNVSDMRQRCLRLHKSGHIKRTAPQTYALTTMGLQTLGYAVEVPTTSAQRICNAAMREPYEPAKHCHMRRVGVAQFGAGTRIFEGMEA